MTNQYRVFGLTVSSPLPLPALAVPSGISSPADIVISYGDTPAELSAPQVRGIRFQAAPGEFLLRVDDVARFYVQGGYRITITPENGAHDNDLLPFLMGSAFGALLQQRRILVLHASAIEANDAAVVFCGPSGIGKSTLAAGFHRRGYRFLADDLCAISLAHEQPAVFPGFPRLKLWADSLKRLDTSRDDLQCIRWGADLQKFFLPTENRCEEPVVLRSVFILNSTNSGRLELTPVPGTEKVDPLIANSYRMRFLHGLGGKKEHFKLCATVAARARVCHVSRPQRGFLLEELMDLLEGSFLA